MNQCLGSLVDGRDLAPEQSKECNSHYFKSMFDTIHNEYSRETPQRSTVTSLCLKLWTDDQGQDIAEYAVMLAVILVLVVGTVRLIGTKSNTVFSNAASSIQ